MGQMQGRERRMIKFEIEQMTNNLSLIKEGVTKDLAVKLIMKSSFSAGEEKFLLFLY